MAAAIVGIPGKTGYEVALRFLVAPVFGGGNVPETGRFSAHAATSRYSQATRRLDNSRGGGNSWRATIFWMVEADSVVRACSWSSST